MSFASRCAVSGPAEAFLRPMPCRGGRCAVKPRAAAPHRSALGRRSRELSLELPRAVSLTTCGYIRGSPLEKYYNDLF